MRNGIRLCATVLSVAMLTLPARAQPPTDARQLYLAGEYMAAVNAAQPSERSEDQAFVAQALLAACLTSVVPEHIETMLRRAEGFARTALDRDPTSVEARLQLALVYGLLGRRASITEAFARGYAPRGRRLIEEALQMAPGDARAHALLGAWHLEVLRRAGRTGAFIYGAHVQDGIRAFQRARELSPQDPVIALRYAAALIELDPAGYAERALEQLRSAADTSPQDALGIFARESAIQLALTLQTQGPRAAAVAALARGL